MPGHTLTCDLVVPAPLDQVFAFFENPYNLANITPPWLNFRILTPDLRMALHAEIDYEFRWMHIPLRWRTIITAYDPPHLFRDEALSSPYAYWRHTHTFHETLAGTMVSDRVEYALPLGPLGRFVHKLAVCRQLTEIFTYRQNAIARLLSQGAVELHPPSISTAA